LCTSTLTILSRVLCTTYSLCQLRNKGAIRLKHDKTAVVAAAPHHRELMVEVDFVSAPCINAIRGVVEEVLTKVFLSIEGFPPAAASLVAATLVASFNIDAIAEPFTTYLDIENPTDEDFANLIAALTDPNLLLGLIDVDDIIPAILNSGTDLNIIEQGILLAQLVDFFVNGGLENLDLESLDLPDLLATVGDNLELIVDTCVLGNTPPTAAPVPPEPVCEGFEIAGICLDCFSGLSTVDVQGQGITRMDALKVGDAVLTADGTYSEVYSYGHFAPERKVEYLQIQTDVSRQNQQPPLEISAEHLLYANGKLVPASQVKVGDALQESTTTAATAAAVPTQVVVSLRKVTRRGAYAPFTKSGNLVVNGVVASSYVAFPSAFESYLSHSQQNWMQHAALQPIRAFCAAFGCADETHDQDTGYTQPVMLWMRILVLAQQINSPVFMTGFLYLFALPTLWLFLNMSHVAAALLGYYVWKKTHKKSNKKHAPVVEKPVKV